MVEVLLCFTQQKANLQKLETQKLAPNCIFWKTTNSCLNRTRLVLAQKKKKSIKSYEIKFTVMSSVQWHVTKNNAKTKSICHSSFFFVRFTGNEFTLRTEEYFIQNILRDQLPSNIPIWIFTVFDKYTRMPVDVAFVWQNVQLHVFRIDYWDFQRPRLAFWHSCELWLWKIVTHYLRWVAVLLASKRFFLRNCI